MRLTLHADYSLRVLIYLSSQEDRLVSTAEISKAYGISKHHLVRVVQTLSRGGFVELYTGRLGGIKLAHQPADIKIGDVVRHTEPDFQLAECFDKQNNTCPIVPVCGLKAILNEAGKAFLAALDRFTLADIVNGPNKAYFISYFLKGPLVKSNLKKPDKVKEKRLTPISDK